MVFENLVAVDCVRFTSAVSYFPPETGHYVCMDTVENPVFRNLR